MSACLRELSKGQTKSAHIPSQDLNLVIFGPPEKNNEGPTPVILVVATTACHTATTAAAPPSFASSTFYHLHSAGGRGGRRCIHVFPKLSGPVEATLQTGNAFSGVHLEMGNTDVFQGACSC